MGDKDNIIKKFYKCLYDVNSFSRYAKEGIKLAIIYIVCLGIIFGGIKGAVASYTNGKLVSELTNTISGLPYDFNIDNGKLDISQSPITIQKNNLAIYIDDKKTLNQEQEVKNIVKDFDNGIIALQDGISYLNEDNTISQIKYEQLFATNYIEKDMLINEINKFKIQLQVAIVFNSVLTTILNLITNLFIVAIIGEIISFFLRMVVKYKALWSLVIYSSTLPFLLVTALEVFNPNVNFNTAFILGNLTYLIIILISIKSEIIEKLKSGKL